MHVAVVWLTRDLRVHDHPPLAAACRLAERVVPLFVFDETLLSRSANRSALLVGRLAAAACRGTAHPGTGALP